MGKSISRRVFMGFSGVIALARAVNARISGMGERPGLAKLLLREPLAFSHPRSVMIGQDWDEVRVGSNRLTEKLESGK